MLTKSQNSDILITNQKKKFQNAGARFDEPKAVSLSKDGLAAFSFYAASAGVTGRRYKAGIGRRPEKRKTPPPSLRLNFRGILHRGDNMEIKDSFRSLIPPLTADEYRQLEENILSDGIRDPLVLWGDVLVDGHNRFEIAQKHGLTFQTVQREFEDEADAAIWIYKNQAGRRNLTDFQRVEMAHHCEDAIRARARSRQSTSTGGASPQLVEKFPQADDGKKARDELGAMAGVSGKTYEHAVTVLESAPEAVKDAARKNDLSINAAYDVTRMSPENQHEVVERIEQGETPRDVVWEIKKREKAAPREPEPEDEPKESVSEWEAQEEKQAEYELNEVLQEHPVSSDMCHIERKDEPAAAPEPPKTVLLTESEDEPVPEPVERKPHVSYNSGNNEWYTPAEYIEAARAVMGSIDLDPASSEIANRIVKASAYYTAETNGLDKEWSGNVWLNPPYASDLIGKFIDKLTTERGYNQAVVLVNNATETEWFFKLVSVASAVVFPKGRVKFYMPDGRTGAPLQGQAILYIGEQPDKFLKAFSKFGWGCTPYGI